MNVIVSNKQKTIIDNANIDAIKDLNGLFNVEEIISKFKNYFFSKMIIDATSIVNFTSREVLEKLTSEIGSERLVILLPSSPEPPKEFLKLLVELKIYNFSTNIEDIVNFLTTPNTLDKVNGVEKVTENNFYVDNSIKAGEMPTNESVNSNQVNSYPTEQVNVTSQDTGYEAPSYDSANTPSQEDNYNVDVNDNYQETNYQENNYANNTVDNNFYSNANTQSNFNQNYSYTYNGLSQDNNYNSNNNTSDTTDNSDMSDFYTQNSTSYEDNGFYSKVKRVIGIKNVTDHAGSTSLAYMLTKVVNEELKKRAMGIEVNREDFNYYQDSNFISVKEQDLKNSIDSCNAEIIFVDLNNCADLSVCSEVLYLIEPSLIKLNKLMMTNPYTFRTLYNKKIVLNKSMLSHKEASSLAKEAGVPILFNISYLNDRVSNRVLVDLLHLININ